jgi:capsular exopolysaccharide synthesis family protein
MKNMDTGSYSALLRRRKWLIIGTFVLTILVVGIGTLLVPPRYEATATLRVETAARGSLDWVDYDISYTERLMNTYARVATSNPVLQKLAQHLGDRTLPEISTEVIPETELMTITAQGEDPAQVAEAANALTAILVNQTAELYAEGNRSAGDILAEELTQAEAELVQAQEEHAAALAEGPEDSAQVRAADRTVDLKREAYATLLSQYERARIAEQMRSSALSIVELASTPSEPTAPNLPMNLVLGALLGLGGGLGLAVLFQRLDRRLYTEAEVEEVAGLPVLATIGHSPRWRSLLLSHDAAHRPDMYHRLRASLEATLADRPRMLLITSAQPGEGKSILATNLAIAMGQAGRRVVLVEANLHQPAVHANLSVQNRTGLSALVRGKSTLSEAVQVTSYPGVWALTSGPLGSTPVQILSSPAMAELLESLETEFDVVLLDGPSVLGAADASVLATLVEGLLLVVSLTDAKRDAVQAARQQLLRINARLLGVVVNHVPSTGDERFQRYYNRGPALGHPSAEKQRPARTTSPAHSQSRHGRSTSKQAADEKRHEHEPVH